MEERFRRTFLRVDFNVPMKNGQILEDFRIRQAIPTIRGLLEQKALVVVASHFGRPTGDKAADQKKLTLLPVAERLAELLDHEVIFSEECTGEGVAKLISDGRGGRTVIVLENLRFEPGEEANDRIFAEELFKNCDVYVNDAFGASHRAHASIAAITEFARYKAAGSLLSKEWTSLTSVLNEPVQPQMAVLGGAKISDKMQVIKSLMLRSKTLFIGGRMGLTFLAAQGCSLGGTSIEEESLPLAKRILGDARDQGVKVILPFDGRAAESIDATEAKVISLGQGAKVPANLKVFDIGPETLKRWQEELGKTRSVIWNGPMGVFENPVFAEGTLGLVDYLVSVKDKVQTTAGGGETVAAIMQRGAFESLHHVSTGGGAMLEFLEGKDLPGFEALKMREREIEALRPKVIES
jgi:phosphoglycerate kinase